MKLLKILRYPDKRLKKIASPVLNIDNNIVNIVSDMSRTMYYCGGIGLAATQVNIHKRIIIIDISNDRNNLQVFINPKIKYINSKLIKSNEGCLSIPKIRSFINRIEKINITAYNENNKFININCDSLLSCCIQHEMDHLIGCVFIESLLL